MKKLDKQSSEAVAGGAQGVVVEEFRFHCKKCGHTWNEKTANPGDRHGCPKCGWWFMSKSGNRDSSGNLVYDNECLEYKPTNREDW